MPVTTADVARRCGVSRHTVSGVLGARSQCFAEETRRKVEQAAEAMGYRPNAGSRALRSGRSDCIALLCDPDWRRTHLPLPLLHGLVAAAEAEGMHLAITRLPDLALAERVPLLRASLMADGMVLNYNQPLPELDRLVAATRLPAVWINLSQARDAVLPDDQCAGRMAAELLLRAGHRRLAWVDPWPPELGTQPLHHSRNERLSGFRAAVTEAGLEPRVIIPDRCLVAGEEHRWFCEVLRHPDRPSGLVAVDGEQAGGDAVIGAALAGLSVPRDLSVVVINGQYAKAGRLLSTVLLPWEAIADEAVAMLRHKQRRPREENPSRRIQPVLLNPEGSVAPPTA